MNNLKPATYDVTRHEAKSIAAIEEWVNEQLQDLVDTCATPERLVTKFSWLGYRQDALDKQHTWYQGYVKVMTQDGKRKPDLKNFSIEGLSISAVPVSEENPHQVTMVVAADCKKWPIFAAPLLFKLQKNTANRDLVNVLLESNFPQMAVETFWGLIDNQLEPADEQEFVSWLMNCVIPKETLNVGSPLPTCGY